MVALVTLLAFCVARNWETVVKGVPTRVHPNWRQLAKEPSPHT